MFKCTAYVFTDVNYILFVYLIKTLYSVNGPDILFVNQDKISTLLLTPKCCKICIQTNLELYTDLPYLPISQ